MIRSQDSKQQTPDVSIIIPTYNRLSMLEDALRSVCSQDFDGTIEIIVVDDNSQDGTSKTITQKYPFIQLISFKQNIGPSAARNRAILATNGKYIAFLDSDDLWESNYLRFQIAALESHAKCISISKVLLWDTVKNVKRVSDQRPNLEKYTSPIHHLLASNFIATLSSIVIPRQAFVDVGLFDETMMLGEDADLMIRCLLTGYNLIFTELPVAIKREHGNEHLTNHKNFKVKQKCRFRRINKFYALSDGRVELVPSSRRVYAETHGNFAKHCFRNKDVLQGLASSLATAYYSSPTYALSIMIPEIRALLKIGTRLKMMSPPFLLPKIGSKVLVGKDY